MRQAAIHAAQRGYRDWEAEGSKDPSQRASPDTPPPPAGTGTPSPGGYSPAKSSGGGKRGRVSPSCLQPSQVDSSGERQKTQRRTESTFDGLGTPSSKSEYSLAAPITPAGPLPTPTNLVHSFGGKRTQSSPQKASSKPRNKGARISEAEETLGTPISRFPTPYELEEAAGRG